MNFKSVQHQGHFARTHGRATIHECPYPARSQTSEDWMAGWHKADKGEPWGVPTRKQKVARDY